MHPVERAFRSYTVVEDLGYFMDDLSWSTTWYSNKVSEIRQKYGSDAAYRFEWAALTYRMNKLSPEIIAEAAFAHGATVGTSGNLSLGFAWRGNYPRGSWRSLGGIPGYKATDVGAYGTVRGHHIHAKKAFEGNPAYDDYRGLSISNAYMKQRGWDHGKMTTAQRRLFKELAESGRPNTLAEHDRIAIEALVAGKVPRSEAVYLVQQSRAWLNRDGVTAPTRIPWY